jgi:hypothetical protein
MVVDIKVVAREVFYRIGWGTPGHVPLEFSYTLLDVLEEFYGLEKAVVAEIEAGMKREEV